MNPTHTLSESVQISAEEDRAVHSIQATLRIVFGLLPIAAGADKFANFLTNWEQYLNPLVLRIVPVTATTFMHIVGIIEIVAGILVLAKPRLGASIVALWLLAIALQLLAAWIYVDVAVRDIVMAFGAWTLARLTPFAQTHKSENRTI
jgi:uncharacterized membrane protein YphA (DoxX/SURF4 family)